MAKSAAAAVARRVGRVSTTAVSTTRIVAGFLKAALSPLSNLVKRTPTHSLRGFRNGTLAFLFDSRYCREI